MTAPLFHLAIPVDDLVAAEAFYGEVFGCPRGRRSDSWIDFDFFGHQLVTHLAPEECGRAAVNQVDGKNVPVTPARLNGRRLIMMCGIGASSYAWFH